MDWLLAICFLIANVVISSSVIFACNRWSSPKRNNRRSHYGGKFKLPPPGGNFDLYHRVKKLLNELEKERDEARQLYAETKRHRDIVSAERDHYEAKLRTAQDLLRAWTHSGMEIRISEKLHLAREMEEAALGSSKGTITL